jgi:hypothetical protein
MEPRDQNLRKKKNLSSSPIYRIEAHAMIRRQSSKQSARYSSMFYRLVIIILFALADLPVYAATLEGEILANEIGGSPMADVSVRADGGNPTTSDVWGRFALEFPLKHPGDLVNLFVKKEGYVVVNDVQLLDVTIPANPNAKLLTIILCKTDDREEMARRFDRLHGGQNDSQFVAGTSLTPSETTSRKEGVEKSLPSLNYKARWELLRTFMHWHIPKDSAELTLALTVNLGALGLAYFLFVLALYAIAPTKFAAWHELIANREIPFGENLSKILAPFLLDTPHCLNAVARRYRQRARHLFEMASEVKARPKWVPAPLLLGDQLFYDYLPPIAKPAEKPYVPGLEEIKGRLGKSDERWTISIEGPGGVGKSALAFEIARWASDSRADYRLAPFPILPILLESLERSADKAETVDAAASAQLRYIMNAAKISDRLLQALLTRKRVLAVCDGFSEMLQDETHEMIRPEKGTVYTHALVVTSRIATNLHESLVIRPQGLTLAFLDRVLDGLIAANVGPNRFTDGEREELRQYVRSLIEGARDGSKENPVPTIFLKLMIERADQLLKEKKRLYELPRTLSQLVTEYTEQLLRTEPDIHLAMQRARTAAQVCTGKERSPVARSESRYASKGVSKEILDKFVITGLMVRLGEKGDPFYKFALDPIAEQLDANRLVIDIREDRADQAELDDLLVRWEELPEDFVRALRRAAAKYRQKICTSFSAISLKLWPPESDEAWQSPIESIQSNAFPSERSTDAQTQSVKFIQRADVLLGRPRRSRPNPGGDETYEVILLNDANTPPGVYEDAMGIYRESFGTDQLAVTQEIAYWRFEYNSRYASTNDRFYLYALLGRGITCGFAMIAFMSEMNVVILNYLVISKAHRHGLFAVTDFYNGIKRHLHSRNYRVDYAVAEIDVDRDSYENSKDVWELFRWLNFHVVDLDYRGAPITDNSWEPVRLALWSANEQLSLSPDDMRRIIHCIFEWNRRWYEALMPPEEFSIYLDNFKARLAHDESQLNSATRIQLLERLPPKETNVGSTECLSCFVSSSNEDKDFASKFAADLGNSGVECWIAPHDLPIGAKLLEEILSEIEKRDKLLVILSAASINSPWVQAEVHRALELEKVRNAVVLFPIRIDEALISTEMPWAVNLRTRNIGDFSLWKKRSYYRRNLARLLNDLKASG